MGSSENGTARMACIVTVSRNDLQHLVREGWVLIGDGDDYRGETRQERHERRRNRPDLDELKALPKRERDPGINAAEDNADVSALLYLNGATRDDVDVHQDFGSYVQCNVTLESLYELLDGQTVRWGDSHGRPLYLDSDGVRRVDELRTGSPVIDSPPLK